jgi:hypothetical protein
VLSSVLHGICGIVYKVFKPIGIPEIYLHYYKYRENISVNK